MSSVCDACLDAPPTSTPRYHPCHEAPLCAVACFVRLPHNRSSSSSAVLAAGEQTHQGQVQALVLALLVLVLHSLQLRLALALPLPSTTLCTCPRRMTTPSTATATPVAPAGWVSAAQWPFAAVVEIGRACSNPLQIVLALHA